MDQSANTPEPDATDRTHHSTDATTPDLPHAPPPTLADDFDHDDFDHHELEDEGPLPELDPLTDASVRALLAAASDTGPMPHDVAERIEAALADETRLRVDPAPTRAVDPDDAVLTPLIRQRQRPRPLLALAAVAAAAAVVAVGASALHLTKRPNGAAALGDTTVTMTGAVPSSPTPTSPTLGDGGATVGTPPPVPPSLLPPTTVPVSPMPGATNPNLHIRVSRTAYDPTSLPTLARRLLTQPGPELPPLAAEAPHLGPVATETGLAACLDALGVPTDRPVHADLAFFDGRPAVVIVASTSSGDTAYVVERTCSAADAHVLHPATPVP